MTKAVEVTPGVAGVQISAGTRQLLLIIGGAVLSRFIPKETVDILLSNDVVNAALGLASAGALIWGQLHTRKAKETLVAAANAAPDTKFVVKDKS